MANDPERSAALMPEILKALSSVFDPEIPVNIYDLGLSTRWSSTSRTASAFA